MPWANLEFWQVASILMVTAAVCAVPGVFLILRKMVLLTDAIGHVLLLGIVLAYLLLKDIHSPGLMLGAGLMGLFAVVAIEWLTRHHWAREDAAIGLVFPGLFALGILLSTVYIKNVHLDIDRILLGVPELAPLDRFTWGAYDLGPKSLVIMACIGAINATAATLFFKQLKLTTFDPTLAILLGISPGLIHYGLMTSVSLTAVCAFDSVGPVLVVAFFVFPGQMARCFVQGLARMIVLSVLIAALSAFIGTTIAFLCETTTAGTVTVVMAIQYLSIIVGRQLYRRRQRPITIIEAPGQA